MTVIKTTPQFDKWLKGIKDVIFIRQLNHRIKRIEQGNFGFHKRLSEYLYELKFKNSKGYRIYYAFDDDVIILWAGAKDTQNKDIKKASEILKQYME